MNTRRNRLRQSIARATDQAAWAVIILIFLIGLVWMAIRAQHDAHEKDNAYE